MDENMDQLVESIKTRGVLTPVTLRQKDDGRYEMIAWAPEKNGLCAFWFVHSKGSNP